MLHRHINKNLFKKFFFAKLSQLFAEAKNKHHQTHSSKDESTGKEGTRAGIVSVLCAGRTMKEIMSFRNINKSPTYDDKGKFDKFMRNMCRRMNFDSWKSPLHLLAVRQPCLRK
jgi:hypothetical protein